MQTRKVNTYISKGLYDALRREREMLRLKENKKRGRRRKITMIHASNSLLRKLVR